MQEVEFNLQTAPYKYSVFYALVQPEFKRSATVGSNKAYLPKFESENRLPKFKLNPRTEML